MRMEGIEPSRQGQQILSLPRLPVPPHSLAMSSTRLCQPILFISFSLSQPYKLIITYKLDFVNNFLSKFYFLFLYQQYVVYHVILSIPYC